MENKTFTDWNLFLETLRSDVAAGIQYTDCGLGYPGGGSTRYRSFIRSWPVPWISGQGIGQDNLFRALVFDAPVTEAQAAEAYEAGFRFND